MNCLEFRRALGADPNHVSPESLAHRAQCPACEKYAQEMLRLNGLIRRALAVPVRSSRKSFASRSKLSWYAMAASLLLVIGFGGTFWFLGFPRTSLAGDVVAHLAHEPSAMTVVEARVSAELLDGALRAKGMHLARPINDVSYLQSCLVRGNFVPHLVVQTDRGPVTVLLLSEEKVSGTQHFDERQYHGVLVPMEHGGMAVIATDASLVDGVAERVKASVVWNR